MRRLVITAVDSAFGMELVRQLAKSDLSEFEWILGTWFDAKEALDALLVKTPRLSEKLKLKQVDMRDMEAIEALKRELSELEAVTDFVHLPAPKAYPLQFKKLSWDVFQDHMEISFRSAVLLLQEILPAMAKKKEGRVVLMSSYYGTEEGTPNFLAPYVSTKSAMLGLMRALSKEYGPKKLRINAMAPDLTDTKFLDEMPQIMKDTVAQNSPRGRMLSAEEVVSAMLPLLDPLGTENGRTVVVK